MSYTILTECGVKTDFNQWNPTQNRYGSKEYKPKRQPPKKLVQAVIREFEQWCKSYHVDASAYRFIEPCEIEGTWRQFDFIDNPDDKYPAKIQIHSIVANSDGKIFQRVIDVS
jgi:hypothetical protein